jgi:hypothetical protein
MQLISHWIDCGSLHYRGSHLSGTKANRYTQSNILNYTHVEILCHSIIMKWMNRNSLNVHLCISPNS